MIMKLSKREIVQRNAMIKVVMVQAIASGDDELALKCRKELEERK